jgi:hypothetical protein
MKTLNGIFMLLLFVFPALALAQVAGDMDIGSFVNQVFNDAQSLQNLGSATPLWLGVFALVIRAFTSLVKVSFLRNLMGWDKWPNAVKMLWAPALGVLMVVAEVRPFTYQAVVVGLFTGVGAIAVHALLDTVEGLPGISSTVLVAIKFVSTLFRGDTAALVAAETKKIDDKKAARLAKAA